MLVWVLGLAAVALASSSSSFTDEEESAVVHFSSPADDARACFGQDCFSTVFCFQGESSLDVTWVATEVVAVVEFDRKIKPVSFACESEDDFSLKSLFHLHTSRPETRLLARQSAAPSLLSKVFGLFSSQQSGENHQQQLSSRFEVRFSPFGSSCFQMKAEGGGGKKDQGARVRLETRSVLDVGLVPVAALGLVLLGTSKRLSTMTEFYYLSGASLGVVFAVSVLVLVGLHMVNGRGEHSRSQFGLAALMQASVLFMRKSVVDFLGDYVEYVVVYVVVSFSASLALIHYLLRTPEGVVLNPGLCDILNVLLACAGAGLVAYCTTRSPRWQVGMVFATCVYTMLFASRVPGTAKAPRPFSTPSRSRSGPSSQFRPKTPDQALEFIAQNHHKFVLNRFQEDDEDSLSGDSLGEDEYDSGEGEGDLHYD